MKIKIAIVALTLTAAYSGFSQGEVQFNNGTATKISANTAAALATFSVLPSGSGAYYYALFGSTTATTVAGVGSAAEVATPTVPGTYAFSDANWTFEASGVQGAKAGTFASSSLDAAGYTQLVGQPSTVQLVVVGWSANIGTSIASVEAFLAGTDGSVTSGFIGESAVSGAISTGAAGTGNLPPTIFGGSSPDIAGFDLGYTVSVPEPSTIALGIMGAASLLALRRKKA